MIVAHSPLHLAFVGFGDAPNLYIPELDDVIDAIRQPDVVLGSIITQLVNTEDLAEEPDSVSEVSEHEAIEDICGVAGLEQ